MKPFLDDGKDVFYLSFSSGLSGSCDSSTLAARDLREEYPDRKIIVIDGLAASMGQGLFVYKLQNMRKNGATMDELAKWAEDNRDYIVHMVAADDLMHLHRGGRVSKVSAVAGTMLSIKPLIHVDYDGKLKVIDKIRGRKGVLDALVKNCIACGAKNVPNDFFMVSHADSLEDAKYVAEAIQKEVGIKDHMINFIGPVIGSHTGPGVIALFMMGEKKKP
jgi:DegV family protein with EDD domain